MLSSIEKNEFVLKNEKPVLRVQNFEIDNILTFSFGLNAILLSVEDIAANPLHSLNFFLDYYQINFKQVVKIRQLKSK